MRVSGPASGEGQRSPLTPVSQTPSASDIPYTSVAYLENCVPRPIAFDHDSRKLGVRLKSQGAGSDSFFRISLSGCDLWPSSALVPVYFFF